MRYHVEAQGRMYEGDIDAMLPAEEIWDEDPWSETAWYEALTEEGEEEARFRRSRSGRARGRRPSSRYGSVNKRRAQKRKPAGRRRPHRRPHRRPPRRYPRHGRPPVELKVSPAQPANEFVRWVQSTLNLTMNLNLRINGVMGPATRNAIRDFQTREGLAVDGIVGPETKKALSAARVRLPRHTSEWVHKRSCRRRNG